MTCFKCGCQEVKEARCDVRGREDAPAALATLIKTSCANCQAFIGYRPANHDTKPRRTHEGM